MSSLRAPAPMIDVHLHGPLADKYGGDFRFAARNPAEVMNALCANFPTFRSDFLKQPEWAFLVDGDWRPANDVLGTPMGKSIDICPVINGRAFLGAALITALIPGISAGAANIIGGLLVAGLLLGVSMFLSPKPKQKPTQDAKKDESYLFSGPENVTEQGGAVPIIYGRCYVGSTVVSAALETSEIKVGGSGGLGGGGGILFPDSASRRATAEHTFGHRTITGPAGWTYVGDQVILWQKEMKVTPMFVSPDGTQVWDQFRGTLNISETSSR